MAHKRNPFVIYLLTSLTIGFGAVTRLMPLPLARLTGKALATVAYHAVPRIKKVGLKNLDLAYGDSLSNKEKRTILKGAVRNVGLVAAEFSRTPLLGQGKLNHLFDLHGDELLNQDHGILLVSAHVGNWEWMIPALTAHGYRLAEVVRPLDDPLLDKLINDTRTGSGVKTIPKFKAGKTMLDLLQENYSVGLLADQSPRTNGIPVTFFGQQCWATIGPAMIAMRSQLPIRPISMIRNPDGRYALQIYPAIEMTHSGNMVEDLRINTQRCQDAIERLVREHPEQWLWFHRRWKKRERLETEWQQRLTRKESLQPLAKKEINK